jgi:solute carrier family 9 (sodium/hydrogen exchanger), member 8
MMLLCPWVSYLIAEGLKLSGIVSILTNGVFLSYYATPNISQSAKRVLKMGYETFAYSAETVVFLFLGIGLFAFNHPYEQMGWGLVITTVLNLNFARFLNISITSYLVNCSRIQTKINTKVQFVMWMAGLRGAMAYALALKASTELPIGPIILIDTLIYAFITILGIGSILNPVLSKLGVKRKEETGEEPEGRDNCCSRFKKAVRNFDSAYFSPLFIK